MVRTQTIVIRISILLGQLLILVASFQVSFALQDGHEPPFRWWSKHADRVYDLVLIKQRHGMDRLLPANYVWMVNIAILPAQLTEDFEAEETFIRILKPLEGQPQVLLMTPDTSLARQLTTLRESQPELALEDMVKEVAFDVTEVDPGVCSQIHANLERLPSLSIPLTKKGRSMYLEATQYRVDVRTLSSELRLTQQGPRSLDPSNQRDPLLHWIAELRHDLLACYEQ